jgi:hypothetical protein
MIQARKIDHDFVFYQEDVAPIINLSYPYDRWRYVVESRRIRYRATADGYGYRAVLSRLRRRRKRLICHAIPVDICIDSGFRRDG